MEPVNIDRNEPPQDARTSDRHEDAKRVHQESSEFARLTFEKTIEFSVVAIRSMMLINGGAAVAMLAFLPSTWAENAPEGITEAVPKALWFFSLGTLAAASIAGIAYLSQYFFSLSFGMNKSLSDYPYIEQTGAAKIAGFFGVIFQLLGLLSGITSLVMFFLAVQHLRIALLTTG